MYQKTDAKDRFMETAMKYKCEATANFKALIILANHIYNAEAVGLKLDADSVEQAVKNVLGVK